MNKVTRSNPKITRRRAALIALPVFVAVLVWALYARVAPVDATTGQTPVGKLPLWVAIATSGIAAMMAGAVLSLAISNYRRWRVVLHPNLGRVLGTLTLWFLTPLTIFAYVPWILGPTLGFIVFGVSPPVLALSLLGLLLWYPVSCLLVSGVGHRLLRVALFSLVWWGSYSALLLYLGYQVFRL